jgi:hypothetical protein
MNTTVIHNSTSASMLGHLFFQKGALPLPDVTPSDRSNEVVAGVVSSVSRPWSLRSSRASSGVCSVVLLDLCDGAERAERVDLWEAGRELGVRVSPHVCSGESMAAAMG